MKCILGKKLYMTQLFRDDGTRVSVTVVEAGPCTVTAVHGTDGDIQVQLGYGVAKRLNRARAGHLKEMPAHRTLKAFHVDSAGENARGTTITATAFSVGDRVYVSGVSKGRGFQGVVKRHGFHGAPATHGTKDQLRMPGSIASRRQGPTARGQRMAGRMGNDRVTVKNLEVVQIDAEKNLLYLRGPVPGARGTLLEIYAPPAHP